MQPSASSPDSLSPPASGRVFAFFRRRGLRLLYFVDAVLLIAAMHVITLIRFGNDWPTFGYGYYLTGFVLATIILILCYYFGGLYEYEQRLGRPPWLPRVSMMTLVGVLLASGVALATGRYLMPRGNLLALVFLASWAAATTRWLSGRVRVRRFGHPNVLLVGTDRDIALARDHMNESGSDATVAGEISDVAQISDAVRSSEASDVLLLSGQPLAGIFPEPLSQLEERKVGVFRRVMPEDTLLGLQRSREIASMPFVSLRSHAVPMHKLRLKRVIDVSVLVCLSPVLLAVVTFAACYTRIVAGRGVIFRQERVGQYGRRFDVWKFRTMVPDAESLTGAVLASENDPRVVPGMQWFRSFRFDELPQIWNVLQGTMSLVGPRPERPNFVADFEHDLPGYARRHDIPPGITGLAQVRGQYQTDPAFKLGHDLQYIVNWSPVLDLEIMVQTVFVMARQSAR